MGFKKKIDKSYTLFIILFLLSSGMLLSNESFKSIKESSLSIFSVFQQGLSNTINFTQSTVNSVSELKNLKAKYDILNAELQEYRVLNRDLLEVKNENQEYKRLLGFRETLAHDSISCEIIGKDPSNLSSAITISKGSKDGIERDMPVVSEQNGITGVVGKVISVGVNTSLVLPLLDQHSYIAGRITESRYEGLVKGFDSLDGFLKLDYIKKIALDEIHEGDLVETSGMNSLYPKGYYIGRIVNIDRVDYETSLDVTIEPIINFSKLEYVSVLTTTGDLNE